jgi:sulfane dehydrogenase subunit SoxC
MRAVSGCGSPTTRPWERAKLTFAAAADGPLLPEELQLAFPNRGMPLEALHYDLTPTGLHYLVAHWDIPAVDPAT